MSNVKRCERRRSCHAGDQRKCEARHDDDGADRDRVEVNPERRIGVARRAVGEPQRGNLRRPKEMECRSAVRRAKETKKGSRAPRARPETCFPNRLDIRTRARARTTQPMHRSRTAPQRDEVRARHAPPSAARPAHSIAQQKHRPPLQQLPPRYALERVVSPQSASGADRADRTLTPLARITTRSSNKAVNDNVPDHDRQQRKCNDVDVLPIGNVLEQCAEYERHGRQRDADPCGPIECGRGARNRRGAPRQRFSQQRGALPDERFGGRCLALLAGAPACKFGRRAAGVRAVFIGENSALAVCALDGADQHNITGDLLVHALLSRDGTNATRTFLTPAK